MIEVLNVLPLFLWALSDSVHVLRSFVRGDQVERLIELRMNERIKTIRWEGAEDRPDDARVNVGRELVLLEEGRLTDGLVAVTSGRVRELTRQ